MAAPHVAGAFAVLYSISPVYFSAPANGYYYLQVLATLGRISDVKGSPNRLLSLSSNNYPQSLNGGNLSALPAELRVGPNQENTSPTGPNVLLFVGIGCAVMGLAIAGFVVYKKRQRKNVDEVILLNDIRPVVPNETA